VRRRPGIQANARSRLLRAGAIDRVALDPGSPLRFGRDDGERRRKEHKIQIITIADLLDGRDRPDLPFIDASVFRKARREAGPENQLGLDV
jgi:hypothetical protein